MPNLKLNCTLCKKDMGVIRDGKVRENMIVYCAVCDASMRRELEDARRGGRAGDVPEFLRGIFGGKL